MVEKKKYIKPEIIIEAFEEKDIIATSDNKGVFDNSGFDTGFIPKGGNPFSGL
ncbi:MAG: hypothetical protein MJ166_08980 [Clostridia bacterium]|nr:hypothetical protein [Clostridia bacterium]